MREAFLQRKTAETAVAVSLSLDGGVLGRINTGVGFLDHMLTLFSAHSGFALDVECAGDTRVDYHHSVEDVGITMGRAFASAIGDKRGIARYGDIILPMDEALIMCAVDISGRPLLACTLDIPAQKVGDFDTELTEEFLRAFAVNAGITLHVRQLAGGNSHHIIEGVFKSLGRALGKAAAVVAPGAGVPSTKGAL